MIPSDDYRPAPGWYRHGGVERWHTGHRWTDRTRPLPELREARKPVGPTVFLVLLVAVLLVLLGRWIGGRL